MALTRVDRFALIVSVLATIGAALVCDRVFERMAHIEDEMAYLWQARAIAHGYLTLPSPPEAKSFLVPFVVDYQGRRFSKYPPAWPVMLSFGIHLGVRHLVNPLLGGLGVWLIYRLGKKVFGETVALLSAILTATSPFFLMNSASLLSHPFGLVLSAAFALSWLDAFCRTDFRPRWLPGLTAGGTLGLLALTRPLTAVAVGLPFGMHGLYLLLRGDRQTRRYLWITCLIALALGSLLLLWQYALSGNALLNPYTLWWEYDKVGFGPGYGVTSSGHNLSLARMNTLFSLRAGWHDLFGWGGYSWVLLPFGLFTLGRKAPRWLIASVFPSLVLVYMIYWIGAALFGPRYYYEGLYSLTIFSAAGLAWLAGWPIQPQQPSSIYSGWRKVRPLFFAALFAFLLSVNLIFYTPQRLAGMFGLYGVTREKLAPFLSSTAQGYTPALIVVHVSGSWTDYGTLLELEDPLLNSPFIFIVSRRADIDKRIAAQFPERRLYHYYPQDPFTFYTSPRP